MYVCKAANMLKSMKWAVKRQMSNNLSAANALFEQATKTNTTTIAATNNNSSNRSRQAAMQQLLKKRTRLRTTHVAVAVVVVVDNCASKHLCVHVS